MCVCVCFFLHPQSECLHVWVHLFLWMYFFLSYFLGCETGRWAWTCPMVTYFNNVYSASRYLSHWSCWESWPSMRCTPLPYVLLCSEKDEMLQYLYNGLMVLLGLPAIWNAPKHGPCAKFQTKILLFFLGIYSNKHTLFCVTAPKKTKVLIKQRLALTEIMFGWNAVQNNPQREHQSNERLLFSFSLDFISSVTPADLLYIIYCCCFAQIRNLTNSIRI